MISQATHLIHNIHNFVWHPWGCLILIISLGKSYHSLLRTQLQGLFRTDSLLLQKPLSRGIQDSYSPEPLWDYENIYRVTAESLLGEDMVPFLPSCYSTRMLQGNISGVSDFKS